MFGLGGGGGGREIFTRDQEGKNRFMPVFGLGGGGDRYLPVTKRAKTGSCLCLGWGGGEIHIYP